MHKFKVQEEVKVNVEVIVEIAFQDAVKAKLSSGSREEVRNVKGHG